jgi:hypothetical protein
MARKNVKYLTPEGAVPCAYMEYKDWFDEIMEIGHRVARFGPQPPLKEPSPYVSRIHPGLWTGCVRLPDGTFVSGRDLDEQMAKAMEATALALAPADGSA